jgi:hypothetical protein
MARRKITSPLVFLTKVNISKESMMKVTYILVSQVLFLLEKSGIGVFICQKTL